MAIVIIGIHGLNNKPPEYLLKEWWKKALNEGLSRIGKNISLPDFELIYWANEIYEKPLDPEVSEENDPYFLDEVYTKAPKRMLFQQSTLLKIKTLPYIVTAFKKIFNNKHFIKHKDKLDLLVQKYFYEIDLYFKHPCNKKLCKLCNIKHNVTNKIEKNLIKHKNKEIMLITHSMGSLIAYDILLKKQEMLKINTFVTMGSPIGLPYVLLNIRKHFNINTLQLPVPNSISENWYNFSDVNDLIALNYNLSNEFIENQKGIKPTDYIVTNDYMMRSKPNPHSIYGYLRSPAFSEILAEFIQKNKSKSNTTHFFKKWL